MSDPRVSEQSQEPACGDVGRVPAAMTALSDTTAREQAEDALRESERRLSTLMSNLPGMAYRCLNDADWTMQFVSDGCLPLTGCHRADLLGNRVTSYGNLIHPDDRRMVHDRVNEAIAEKRHFQMEYRIRTASGEEKWVWEQGAGVFLADGTVEAIEGFITDVTGHKHAEQVLSASEAKYRRLHQSMMDAFVGVDMDGYILECNEAYRAMLGYTLEELRSLRYIDLTPEKWHRFEAESTETQVLRRGYSDIYEKEYRRKDGTVFPVELRAILLTDDENRPDGMWAIVRDVTERKQAEESLKRARNELERRVDERTAELARANKELQGEIEERNRADEALRQSEEQYRMLVEACPDAVVMADPQMRIVFASEQAARLCGAQSAEEILGRVLLSFLAEEERPRPMENLPKLLESGLRRETEYTFLHKDGTRFPCEISTKVARYASGDVRGMISVVRDISQRKRAEEALRKEHRTLKLLLQSSDHERQLIAYEIHDGLAQQLAGAIMQFQTYGYLKTAKPDEAKKAYDAAMTMLQQSHFETRRLIAGVRPPILDEYGVVEAIAHLVNELRRQKGPTIEFRNRVKFDRLFPTVENSIYRIAQEALTNACQHSTSDRVRISLVQKEGRVRIEVRDWGVGFDPQITKDDSYGLAGIRERARLLGGRCIIQSAAGKGARIAVELPLVSREA